MAGEEEQLIKDVHEDDDLDMSQYGKPVAAFKTPPAPPTTEAAAPPSPTAGDKADKPADGSAEKKKKKHRMPRQSMAASGKIMSAIDAEIADVGDDDDEDDDGLMTELGMPHSTGGDQTPTGDGASTPTRRAAPPAMSLMDVGRGGGRPIGGPKQDGPKDHAYEIVDGEAKARVYDTQELRAAFLHYCNSSIKVQEMHLVHEGPFMGAAQFVGMCKELSLMEPEGKLSPIMVGIIYTTSKSDDDDGLAFGQFLDALVSLAFECEVNVAGKLQAEWEKRKIAEVSKPSSGCLKRAPTLMRTPTMSQNGAPPDADAGHIPSWKAVMEMSGSVTRALGEKVARFARVEGLTQHADKPGLDVVKIKNKATSRATSVANSTAVSRFTSRLHTPLESDEEDEAGGEGEQRASNQYQVSPAFLSTHLHKALEDYEPGEGGEHHHSPPGSPLSLPSRAQSVTLGVPGFARKVPSLTGPDGAPMSPLFAAAGGALMASGDDLGADAKSVPGSPLLKGHKGLRPTTASRRPDLDSAVARSAPSAPMLFGRPISLAKETINKGFGDDEDSDEEGAHDYDAGAGRSSNLAPKPPRSEPGSKTGAALRASQELPTTERSSTGADKGSTGGKGSSGGDKGGAGEGSERSSGGGAQPDAYTKKPLLAAGLSAELNAALWRQWKQAGGRGTPHDAWVAENAAAMAPPKTTAIHRVSRRVSTTAEGAVLIQGTRRVGASGRLSIAEEEEQGSPSASGTKPSAAAAAAAATAAALFPVGEDAEAGQAGGDKSAPAAAPAGAGGETAKGSLGEERSSAGSKHIEGERSSAGQRKSPEKLRVLTPYEIQLAKLEAKYKKHNAAVAVAEAGGPEVVLASSPSGKLDAKSKNIQPAWKPSGKASVREREARLSNSGGDFTPSPRTSMSGGRVSMSGERAVGRTSMSGGRVSMSGGRVSMSGELSKSGKLGGSNLGKGTRTSDTGRSSSKKGINFSPEQMALMASFGQGLAPAAQVAADAAAAAAAHEAAAAAAVAAVAAEAAAAGVEVNPNDEKFAFVAKRRAEMEAKLAMIEQKFGGHPTPVPPSRPKPPIERPSGGGSPNVALRLSTNGSKPAA